MSLATGYYPRIYAATLHHLAMRDRTHFVGVRVDPAAVYVQVDDASFVIPGAVERAPDPAGIVRDLIREALAGHADAGECTGPPADEALAMLLEVAEIALGLMDESRTIRSGLFGFNHADMAELRAAIAAARSDGAPPPP